MSRRPSAGLRRGGAGGFSTQLFSSFDGTFYVGFLIGLALLVSVVA